jgi:hypothetical protein
LVIEWRLSGRSEQVIGESCSAQVAGIPRRVAEVRAWARMGRETFFDHLIDSRDVGYDLSFLPQIL